MPSRLASSRSCCRWPLRMSRCRSCSSMRLLRSSSDVERAFFQRTKVGEAFELVVDLAAFDPERLQVDGDFEPAGAGGDRFGLGLAGVDFFGQLAELHRRLGPAAALGDQFVQLAAELLLLRARSARSSDFSSHELSSRSRVPSSMWITS